LISNIIMWALSENPTERPLLRNFLHPLNRKEATLVWIPDDAPPLPLRANIDETVPPVIITEQGENRNQCEEQRNVFGFSHGFACC